MAQCAAGHRDRLTGYRLDAEAKAAFREALEAHGASLYRCVCRLLFPEIERVTRRELHGDSMERITSQKALRDLAARLPASVMEPGGFLGLNLFDRLSNHVYEAASDEEARQRLARDPIPNRHAAVPRAGGVFDDAEQPECDLHYRLHLPVDRRVERAATIGTDRREGERAGSQCDRTSVRNWKVGSCNHDAASRASRSPKRRLRIVGGRRMDLGRAEGDNSERKRMNKANIAGPVAVRTDRAEGDR